MAYCGEPTRLGRNAETKSQFNKLLALAGSFFMRKNEENISSLLNASKVIIDFNPNVVNGSGEKYESDKQYGSVLKCKYLFYEKTSAESEHYNHLSVAIAPSSGYYLEST